MASCCRWLNQPASAPSTTRAKSTSNTAALYNTVTIQTARSAGQSVGL